MVSTNPFVFFPQNESNGRENGVNYRRSLTTDINNRLAAYQVGYFDRAIKSAQAAIH